MTTEFPDIPTEALIEELTRRGVSPNNIEKAKQILENKSMNKNINEIIKINEDKIEEATRRTTDIQQLSTKIISLRYIISKNSKLCGKRLFEDNADTSIIGTRLSTRFVTDDDTLLLFINDIHKLLYQSGNWNQLYCQRQLKNTQKRQLNFTH